MKFKMKFWKKKRKRKRRDIETEDLTEKHTPIGKTVSPWNNYATAMLGKTIAPIN